MNTIKKMSEVNAKIETLTTEEMIYKQILEMYESGNTSITLKDVQIAKSFIK